MGIRVVWPGVLSVFSCVHACVCACFDSLCQEAMKWHLGGVRGQSALIPLPVRVSPPWLLAADGSHVSTLWMSALWKGKSGKEKGKQITEGLWGNKPQTLFPHTDPHREITLHVQYEALSATEGADTKLNDSSVALSSKPLETSNVRDISKHGK